MKITKRIPLEAYAYEELEFDSLEDYQENYPKYVEAFKQVRQQIKTQNFENPIYIKREDNRHFDEHYSQDIKGE